MVMLLREVEFGDAGSSLAWERKCDKEAKEQY
jgi:hypothetical protein